MIRTPCKLCGSTYTKRYFRKDVQAWRKVCIPCVIGNTLIAREIRFAKDPEGERKKSREQMRRWRAANPKPKKIKMYSPIKSPFAKRNKNSWLFNFKIGGSNVCSSKSVR